MVFEVSDGNGSPINILLLLDCLYADAGGGSERQLLEFYRHAPEHNINVHICFLRHEPVHDRIQWRQPPLTLDIPSLFSLKALKAAKQLGHYIQENQISLVQTLFDDGARFSILLHPFLDKRKTRTVIGLRNSGYTHKGLLHTQLKIAYRLANRFIVNADYIRSYLEKSYQVDPAKVTVIPNIYNPQETTENTPALDQRFLAARQQFSYIAIIVANLRPIKGIEDLLRAIPKVSDGNKVAYFFIGSGDCEDQYRQLSNQLGITEQVFFLGRKDQVSDYLRNADFAILASHSEGLSNTLIEYVCSGLPTIATRVGGNPEIARDEKSAILVPPKNPDQLAEAITQLIKDFPHFKAAASSAATDAKKRYYPKYILENYRSTYLKLLS